MAVEVDSIAEGMELPIFEREGDVLQWVRYAAVNPVHIVGHHFDDEVARREGFESAFTHGPLGARGT